MIDIRPMFHCCFVVFMGALMPARKRGVFGTPNEPIYFAASDPIPWWVECRWPFHMDLTFGCDSETYYEDGWQIVRSIIAGDQPWNMDAHGWDSLITGAPTRWLNYPRKRPREPVKLLERATSFG